MANSAMTARAPTSPTPPAAQASGERVVQDKVITDLPGSVRTNWSFEDETPVTTLSPAERAALLAYVEEEAEAEDGIDVDGLQKPRASSHNGSDALPARALGEGPPTSLQPRFSRAFSMPLPSQLGQLQNPHRFGSSPASRDQDDTVMTGEVAQFRELSLELADWVQMIIQTMLQISPPQILDPAKEQFSACSLAVPTPSMSAMFTIMKSLNYISANMAAFCAEPARFSGSTQPELIAGFADNPMNDFDIGELLQNVGDALSGSAAQAGVDLVLFHADVGMKHVMVKGDESGISFALSHIVRQTMATAKRGDSIELGLFIGPKDSKPHDVIFGPGFQTTEDEVYRVSSAEADGPLQCIVDIIHRFDEGSLALEADAVVPESQLRDEPTFSTVLLKRLLYQIGGSLTTSLPASSFTVGRACRLNLGLDRGTSVVSTPVHAPPGVDDNHISTEPTPEQLMTFAETLRGKKVALYASSKGSFAHHFTSYLTAWGMNVSHFSEETKNEAARESALHENSPDHISIASGHSAKGPGEEKLPEQPLSFIFIDDDVVVLKERLQALRVRPVESPGYPLNLNPRKRPLLSGHHRRSTTSIPRAVPPPSIPAPPAPPPVVIVHFTSLANYKVIKDMIQSTVASYAGTTTPVPEVMIIPKPAGPRRFLTALHTAVTKPVVDPFFLPIATSPITPGPGANPFFTVIGKTNMGPPMQSPSSRPSGSRSNSDRSSRSFRDIDVNALPASPLSFPENREYFAEVAAKSEGSPQTGIFIRSPDGTPNAILFQPKGKTARSVSSSSQAMERDFGQLTIPPDALHVAPAARAERAISFSSLHEAENSSSAGEAGDSSITSTPRGKGRTASISREELPRQPVARRGSGGTSRRVTPPASPLSDTRSSSARRLRRNGLPTPKGKGSENKIVPPIKVLIVDDNPINQTILSTFMRKKKIKYDVAKDGQEAVDKWRSGGFHLILMDIQMPVMDGIQATQEIRRSEKVNASAGYPPTPGSEIAPMATPLRTPSDLAVDARPSPYRPSVIIVALTASSLQSDRVAALAAGCNDFLTKPVNLEWLNSKIIEWGSIKALQVWADMKPEMDASMTVKARSVADRLHVPAGRGEGQRSLANGSNQSGETGQKEENVARPVVGKQTSVVSPSYWGAGRSNGPFDDIEDELDFDDDDLGNINTPSVSRTRGDSSYSLPIGPRRRPSPSSLDAQDVTSHRAGRAGSSSSQTRNPPDPTPPSREYTRLPIESDGSDTVGGGTDSDLTDHQPEPTPPAGTELPRR
ncbi:hypothetical protein HGRIS_009822 [Hohenbuehelia grisea]|uniref:Response regulatory domain-containing protein n=1 Tax=Hohenbuehelia grisea TaxID=104357 RepID=A0ABR3J2Q9_9AGAR